MSSKMTRYQRRKLKKMLEPFFGNKCPVCQKAFLNLDDFKEAIFGKGKGSSKEIVCSADCWTKYSDQPIKEPSNEPSQENIYLTPSAA